MTLRLVSRAAVTGLVAATVGAVGLGGCGGGEDRPEPLAAQPVSSAAKPEYGDNVVRIPGLSATDVAAAAILAAYPPSGDDDPEGWILTPEGDWQRMVAGAQLLAAPVDAAMLPIERRYLPPAADDLISRIDPGGFPSEEPLHAMILGEAGDEVIAALQERNLASTQIDAPNPAALVGEVVPFRAGWAESVSDSIVIASDEHREFALPAAAWSAFSGDTLAFVEGDTVPKPTLKLVSGREALRLAPPTIYLAGPEKVIPTAVEEQLSAYGEVVRIPGETPVELAVELARFDDPDAAFGWDAVEDPVSLSFLNVNEAGDAYGALNLAGAGPRAPLLLLDDRRRLPGPLERYLRSIRSSAGSQGYVVGDRKSVSSPLLAEIDELLAPRGGRD